jgi:hypothetical protein
MRNHTFLLVLILLLASCNSDVSQPYVPTLIPHIVMPCLEDSYAFSPTLVIDTDSDYVRYVRTTACGDTAIDFSRYTLLGQNGNSGGCEKPFYELSVMRDDLKKVVHFKAVIMERGYCTVIQIKYLWILIPKVPPSYTVTFERQVLRDDEWQASPAPLP